VSPLGRGHALAGTRGHVPSWAAGKRACHFSDFFSRFSISQTLKFKTVTFLMSKVHHILHWYSIKHKEQLSFLLQLQNPKVL
jgi:hypothetical protein